MSNKRHYAEYDTDSPAGSLRCSCGFLPKRKAYLIRHVMTHDLTGYAHWSDALLKQDAGFHDRSKR